MIGALSHAAMLMDAASGSGSALPAFVQSLAPVAYWQMNESIGAPSLVDTIAGATLPLTGAYTLQQPSMVKGDTRKCASFNGGYAQGSASATWALGSGDCSAMFVGKFTDTTLATFFSIRDGGNNNILMLCNNNRVNTGDISTENWNWNSVKANSPITTYNGGIHVVGVSFANATSTLNLYVDGVKMASVTVAAGRPTASSMSVQVGTNFGTQTLIGNMQDLCLFNKLLTDVQMQQFSNLALGDPYWSSVVSLLHFDGTNGSTTVTDQVSTNSWVNGGAALLDTSNAEFGPSAMAFSASITSYIASTTSSLAIGTHDFTWEGFVKRTGSVSGTCIFDMRPTGVNGAYPTLYHDGSGNIGYYVSSAVAINPVGGIALNTYAHVAISRVSGNTRIFVNGVQQGSTYADTNNYLFSAYTVGASGYDKTNGTNFKGYLDDVRLTIGVGRYSANFTPPITPFPNQ